MMYPRTLSFLLLAFFAALTFDPLQADEPVPPEITGISISNSQKHLNWTPFPASVQYKIFHADDVAGPYMEDSSGVTVGYDWTAPLTGSVGYYRLQAVPMSANDLLISTVLNRLAYGPTPDELERVKAMGADAYIQEQLAPESIQENLDIDVVQTDTGWQYVSATGSGSASLLYIYLNSAGESYIDDLKLVVGTQAGVGANLLRNGDFELAFKTNDWFISDNLIGSTVTTDVAHAGTTSLHLIATAGGTTRDSAIWQDIKPALSASQIYTLSYWYLPSTSNPSSLTLRLSGEGIVATPGSLMTKLVKGEASLNELRAWHVLHAVRSKKQLLEVIDQWLENHFVTQHTKSREYFDTYYNVDTLIRQLATQMEFKEHQRWRAALLNPQCTFYDLLKISTESPAMIIYLDTVNSKGNGNNIANENYARELLELFTFGVDNGYDQADIVSLSKFWTGWSVNIVDAVNEFNPLALRSTTVKPGVTNNFTTVSNLVGVWTFNYKTANHNTTAKTLFPGKIVPDRFGPPYAGKSYELKLPARSGNAGINDGHDVIKHLADQPFTQEFISIKFCRLFIHEDFYLGYDFTDPNLSLEGQLVKQCMEVWDSSNPKGQIRAVLATIFNSELFRGHTGSLQKVKTPFEYVVSAVRALRAKKADGIYTAESDGVAMINPMTRMGNMQLFNREEPDGYPESAAGWISAGTLAERLRFVQSLLIARGQAGKDDAGSNNGTDPVALIKLKLPQADWTNAGAVVDYFLSILYPGEGKANLDLYHASAVNYLNTLDDGKTASPFNSLSMTATGNTPSPYENRLRGMVAMLLTFQRFQEQ